MLVCAYSIPLHTRPRVQRAPGIPCALYLSRARGFLAKLGPIRPRDREVMFGTGATSLRGALATKQSILSLRGEMDCFAYARNDGCKIRRVGKGALAPTIVMHGCGWNGGHACALLT